MRKTSVFCFLLFNVAVHAQINMTKVFNGKDSFAISNTEITQAQFEAIMGYNPSRFDCPDCPVETVSFVEAVNFVTILSAKANAYYLLPSEAEWEAVASAKFDPESQAWYKDNSLGQTHTVGTKKPLNQLFDLFGNVWEFTRTTEQKQVVIKGGNWDSPKEALNVKNRYLFDPRSKSDNVGFRITMRYQ